jgi:hypothetical protein
MKIPVNAQETRRDKQEQNSERGQIEHIDQKWKKKRGKDLYSPSKLHIPALTNTIRVRLKKSTEAWQNRQNNTKEGTKNYFSTKGTKNYGL